LSTEAVADTAIAAGNPGKRRLGRPSLCEHADFMKIWSAATVSLMGSQVSQIAIPFIRGRGAGVIGVPGGLAWHSRDAAVSSLLTAPQPGRGSIECGGDPF